jgi:glycosyltransferase involved in cell wall biosynthesis
MLSEALYSILENKEYATKLGKAGSERVKKLFTMERYVTETLEWYLK